MRTTATIDDALPSWRKRAELTRVTERVALLRQGLQTLIMLIYWTGRTMHADDIVVEFRFQTTSGGKATGR